MGLFYEYVENAIFSGNKTIRIDWRPEAVSATVLALASGVRRAEPGPAADHRGIAMTDLNTDRVLAAVNQSLLINAVEQAALELVGIRILFMVRQDDGIVKLAPDGSEAVLPRFCHILRQSGSGQRQCSACRALVSFGACYRGLTEYCCHGGLYVVAAAALNSSGEPSRSMAVCSSAFAVEDREAGWTAVLAHTRNEGVDLRQLRKAYEQLPLLTPTNRSMTKALLRVAAAAIGEIARGTTPVAAALDSGHGVADPSVGSSLHDRLTAALFVGRDANAGNGATDRRSLLAELITDLVHRDPGMPFTVAGIAAAARLTPNHFSTLFRQHTGQTFQQFLTAARIAHAKLLLRDLSLNIADVAFRAGFADAGYFARRFRQLTGVTPHQWRDAL